MPMLGLGSIIVLLDSLPGQSSLGDSASLVPPVAPYPAAPAGSHGSAGTYRITAHEID